MQNEKIRFAVLGCGHIGSRHADMIVANDSCELVAIADTNPAIKAVTEEKYGTRFFSSLDELLAQPGIADVINIATPNALHAPQAIAAIEAGYHVVIEKPVALTAADCQSIINVAEQHGRKVFCVMQNRYSPAVRWLHKLVQQGGLGDIYMVDVHCYWNRDRRYYTPDKWQGSKDLDGGTLFTQFSHYIDILYWLFGDITDIEARFANHNHEGLIDFEDSAMVHFNFVNGGMCSFNYSTSVWDKNMESTLVIIGSKGTVKIGGQYMDSLEYYHAGSDNLQESISSQTTLNEAKANHRYVIQNVVDVLTGKADITTTALEGMKIVDMIERIYALKK